MVAVAPLPAATPRSGASAGMAAGPVVIDEPSEAGDETGRGSSGRSAVGAGGAEVAVGKAGAPRSAARSRGADIAIGGVVLKARGVRVGSFVLAGGARR